MKELEEEAIRELIKFYTSYIVTGIDESLKKQAIKIESKYLSASTLLSDVVYGAVGNLVYFYVDGIPHGKPPTKEEAKEILEKLKKREKELEKS